MTLRRGHGHGKGVPRIEVLPPDELPFPLPATPENVSGIPRRKDGRVASAEAARVLGAKGGRAKATRVALARGLGSTIDLSDEAFRPYKRAANAFRRHHTAELARMCGGSIGSGPASMVASAAMQLAASRYLFDLASKSGDPSTFKTASALSNDSRQNLLAAYELGRREGEAAAQSAANPAPWEVEPK